MPLKLVSMAKTVQEKQDAARPWTEGTPVEKMDDYPYGLTLRLEADELKKLGLNRGQLDPGKKVVGQFVAVITAASASIAGGLSSHSATLQIQELAVEPEPEEDTRAESLFGAANAGGTVASKV